MSYGIYRTTGNDRDLPTQIEPTLAKANAAAQKLANNYQANFKVKKMVSSKIVGPKVRMMTAAEERRDAGSVYFITATHSSYGKVRMIETDSRASALAWIKKYKHMHPESSNYVITKGTRAQWERIYGNGD